MTAIHKRFSEVRKRCSVKCRDTVIHSYLMPVWHHLPFSRTVNLVYLLSGHAIYYVITVLFL